MIELNSIQKQYGDFTLGPIDLSVTEGDYFVLLGPSGAGKSLLVELIAGLTYPDNGKIYYSSQDITHVNASKRNIRLVFQDYALFPHLTISQNIEYGLHKKATKTEKKKIIQEWTQFLGIDHLLKRFPETLSGGEKQRVALARTMVTKPGILLLDEPLSSLDAELRMETSTLLYQLKQKGQTIIHVTHDFSEALALANKVTIMDNGKIVQQGSPQMLFRYPETKFVAGFTGQRNFFRGYIKQDGNQPVLQIDNLLSIPLSEPAKQGMVSVLIDPQKIILTETKPPEIQSVSLKLKSAFCRASGSELIGESDNGLILSLFIDNPEKNIKEGAPFFVIIPESALQIY